ncbi:hypothetical protein B0H21DRAFT_758321 [Amylocystis lapponica]|nr:hypothetical protein B0H21DRAFT_758321 [Amylocystis lapponica]
MMYRSVVVDAARAAEESGAALIIPQWGARLADTVSATITTDMSASVSAAATTAMIAFLQPLVDDVERLKDVVASLKDDVASLKDDVASLKYDMVSTKDDVLKGDTAIKEDINGTIRPDIEVIKQRQATAQRSNAPMHNATRRLGDGIQFEEVPWVDGTFPWGYMHHNNPLPALLTVDAVRNLSTHESYRYYQGYYPGTDDVPDSPIERLNAILKAIGCEFTVDR